MTSTRRYVIAVTTVPLGVLAVGLLAAARVWSSLPDVVASHWGAGGQANATATPAQVVGTGAAIVVLLAVVLGAVGWTLPADGRRLVCAIVGSTTGFLVSVMFGSLVAQAGQDDAFAARLSPWLFVGAVVAGALVGAVAWSLVGAPAPPAGPAPVPPDAPGLDAGPGERLVWFGHTPSGGWVGWVCLGLVVLGGVLAVTVRPWAVIGPAVGIAAILALAHARVVVDQRGLRVTSFGLLTWLRVPLLTVVHAEGSQLRALREFGGFGLRYRSGARAFVTRTGPALEIAQQDGSRTYVSLDDPDEAAAVLNTLARRAFAR